MASKFEEYILQVGGCDLRSITLCRYGTGASTGSGADKVSGVLVRVHGPLEGVPLVYENSDSRCNPVAFVVAAGVHAE
jgi:hypothetical protein